MAQLNITLNQEEILQLLSDNHDQAFRTLLKDSLNSILMTESTAQLKAEPYERSQDRTDCRNGTRERELKTRIGKITLTVPRHRNVPFKTLVFENYSRGEAALVACMAEMVVNGIATRKVSRVMEALYGTSYSKSTVSDVFRKLDVKVKEFREHPLSGDSPFLSVNATYFKVRVSHRIIPRAFMIAYGTKQDGHREILGFGVYDNESKNAFLKSLKERGLKGLLMMTSVMRMKAFRMPLPRCSRMFPGRDDSFISPEIFRKRRLRNIRRLFARSCRRCGTAMTFLRIAKNVIPS